MSESGPGPGIYRDVAFDEYRAWPHINNSTLTAGRRSMRHLRHALTATSEPTPAMEFGTLCHAAILEPKLLHSRYCVMPDLTAGIVRPDGTAYDNVRATKAYKDKVAEWERMETRIPISQEQMTAVASVIESVQSHPRARDWLGLGETDRPAVEVCLVWDDAESGLRCKARLDALWPTRRLIPDVKTTSDALAFDKSIATYGYHRQAAFYAMGAAALCGGHPADWAFGLIAVETSEPYGMRCGLMSVSALLQGRHEVRDLLAQYAAAKAANKWPGYTDPDEWTLPGWYQTDATNLTISGETVAVY